jgi:hypothetical protein
MATQKYKDWVTTPKMTRNEKPTFKAHNPPLYQYNYEKPNEQDHGHYWGEVCALCGCVYGNHEYPGNECVPTGKKATGKLTKVRDQKLQVVINRELAKHKKWRDK